MGSIYYKLEPIIIIHLDNQITLAARQQLLQTPM